MAEAAAAHAGAPPAAGRPGAQVVVDATGQVAGRLCSRIAKLLLQGSRVYVINCEKAMISGTRANIIGEYRKFLEISSILNPKHGPFHPRRPDTILARMTRGMLPHGKKPSGVAAYKRLRTYIGSPRELRSIERTSFAKTAIRRPASDYTTMAELGSVVGWTR